MKDKNVAAPFEGFYSSLKGKVEIFAGAHHAGSPGRIRDWDAPSGPVCGVLVFMLRWNRHVGYQGLWRFHRLYSL